MIPTATRHPEREVRTCAACGKPTMICLHAWKHTMQGVSTGHVTRECRCQTCGAKVTLYDPQSIRGLKIVGWVMVWTIVLPIFLLGMAARRGRAWDRHPLVEGAPYPEVRYRRGPQDRRCGKCGKVAKLTAVTRHRHNGIPTGTDCKYKCVGCGGEFTTESAGGIVFSLFGGALLGGGGLVAFTTARSTAARFGWGALGVALGGVLLVQAVSRVANALRNPNL